MTAYTKYTEKPSLLSARPPPSHVTGPRVKNISNSIINSETLWVPRPLNGNPYTLDFGKFDIKLILIELRFKSAGCTA